MDDTEINKKLELLFAESDFSPKTYVDVMGEKIDVPVKYSDANAFMVFVPISYEAAKAHINNERLKPVSIFKKRALLGVTIFNYTDCQVGPYRELALSIPVLLDTSFPLPVLPLLFDSLYSGYGFYTISLAMNTKIARVHSEKIFGYPTYTENINIEIKNENDLVSIFVSEAQQQILSFSMSVPKSYRFTKKKYKTFFFTNNDLLKVTLNASAYEAGLGAGKLSLLKLGDHPLSKLITSLAPANKPLQGIYYKKAFEILEKPEKIGQAKGC